jgi:hypothetical protein
LYFLIAGAAALGSVAIINKQASNYGWKILIYHSLVEHLTTPATAIVHVTAGQYLRFLSEGIVGIALWTAAPYFLFLGILLFFVCFSVWGNAIVRRYAAVAGIMIAAAVCHFVLYPAYYERHYVAVYTFLATACPVVVAISIRETARSRKETPEAVAPADVRVPLQVGE